MFSGFYNLRTSKEEEINLSTLKNKLFFLGLPILVTPKRLMFKKSETFFTHKTEVNIFKCKNGTFDLNFNYSFNPNFLSWALGICFFPFGFLIFIISNKEKNEFESFLSSFEIE